MTLVTMNQADFETLDDERLGWACVESTLLGIRGKSFRQITGDFKFEQKPTGFVHVLGVL